MRKSNERFMRYAPSPKRVTIVVEAMEGSEVVETAILKFDRVIDLESHETYEERLLHDMAINIPRIETFSLSFHPLGDENGVSYSIEITDAQGKGVGGRG